MVPISKRVKEHSLGHVAAAKEGLKAGFDVNVMLWWGEKGSTSYRWETAGAIILSGEFATRDRH